MSSDKLVEWLFKTTAVRVCPENKPFWYTSGTIGPYYINTHFLYGSENKANELLAYIDVNKSEKFDLSENLLKLIKMNYENDDIFRGLMDEMVSFIKNNIDINEIDYISGGERRDWFFSLLAADMLGKPHITLFKDLDSVVFAGGKSVKAESIKGKKVLHIADLITEASSYDRAWIPAIENLGGKICWSVVVVDRMQGGAELLVAKGVKSLAMVSINKILFEKASEMKLINETQKDMLFKYIDNPKTSMQNFLKQHPEFMEAALNSDEKTKERAKLCLEKQIYE